jgi:hypothetical protein
MKPLDIHPGAATNARLSIDWQPPNGQFRIAALGTQSPEKAHGKSGFPPVWPQNLYRRGRAMAELK